MDNFEYNASPARVIFGTSTLSCLSDEIARLSLQAPLLLSSPNQTAQAIAVKELLNGKVAGIFSRVRMHTPVPITNETIKYFRDQKSDSVISIGGGSTVGLGKAISFRTGLPHICIPTTYAGSEMTSILGETEDGQKIISIDPKILPGTVIYDVNLTISLTPKMTATSGINAIAHAGNESPWHENSMSLYLPALELTTHSGSTLCTEHESCHFPSCP